MKNNNSDRFITCFTAEVFFGKFITLRNLLLGNYDDKRTTTNPFEQDSHNDRNDADHLTNIRMQQKSSLQGIHTF